MFVEAIKIVKQFTFPVLVCRKHWNGSIESAIATFIILNDEGYILTASHVVDFILEAKKHKKEIDEYIKRKKEIENDNSLNYKKKKKEISKLNVNDNWITNYSIQWSNFPQVAVKVSGDKLLDIAVAKFEPFDSSKLSVYPTFKKMEGKISPGTYLCKLGYPFHKINASFDESKKTFTIDRNVYPVPSFPIEGMHTRNINLTDNSGKVVQYIETSTPGLRGQSGGPVFDEKGNIWGIQTRTRHLPLGFSPKVNKGSKEIEEHQFLNVGMSVHSNEIIKFLNERSIQYKNIQE